jgi:hypothetical protein
MTDRFVQIAAELRELFIASMGGETVENEIQSWIKSQQVLMTPEEGWPGKNAEQRQTAQDKAELENDSLAAARIRLRYCQDKRNAIKAHTDSLIAERRALEWQIRRAMVVQMAAQTGTAVDFDSEDATDVQPFEAFIDKASLRAMFEPEEQDVPEDANSIPVPDLVAENEDLEDAGHQGVDFGPTPSEHAQIIIPEQTSFRDVLAQADQEELPF